MNNIHLYTQINTLPPTLREEVKDFVEFLKTKSRSKSYIKERKFGCSKGLFKMHDDFDEPLEDFKDYMY